MATFIQIIFINGVIVLGRWSVLIIITMNHEIQLSDDALIEAIQKGDGSAAARLYHRYIDRVHRICYRIVLDASQVKDCDQEVWLKVFRNLNRFQQGRSFVSWLTTITVNTAIDFYRQAMGRKNVVLDMNPVERFLADEHNGHQVFEEKQIRELIEQGLKEISVTQRTAFTLRYFEEMSMVEIARILDCSENTVRTHVRRSLIAMRKILADKISL